MGEFEGTYRPRDPQSGVLHRVLSEHLLTFLANVEQDGTSPGLPRHVRSELLRAHTCGILAHGFARLRCEGCRADTLVPFSCKGRGFCPSCAGRRMAQTAAHLVDHVLPRVPVRQWVLSVPWRLRYLLASDPALCGAVRRSFVRAVSAFYRSRLEHEGVVDGRTGAVNVVQRFGSALNLNIHFHALVLDGVYTAATPLARPVFHPAPEPEQAGLERLVQGIRDRLLRILRARGLWPKPGEHESVDEPDSILPLLTAASIQGRVALGPDAGRRVERLGQAVAGASSFQPGELCANRDGFSLHAKVLVEAHDRERLEHLCRYVARGPISSERLSLSSEGKVICELRHPFRDGTTHIVFDPLTFIERLACLVPQPRQHQLTYHGVLAPAASWRDLIVPACAPSEPSTSSSPGDASADPALFGPSSSTPATSAPKAESTGDTGSEAGHSATSPEAVSNSPQSCQGPSHHSSRYTWAELLRRVFRVDALRCPACGSRRRLIALITHRSIVHRILAHLNLPADPPALAPPRAPPQLTFPY